MINQIKSLITPFKFYPRILKLIYKSNKNKLFLLIIIFIIMTAMPIIAVYSIELLINEVEKCIEIYKNSGVINYFKILPPFIVLLSTFLLETSLGCYHNSIVRSIIYYLDNDIECMINNKIASFSISLYDSPDTLNLIQRCEKALDHPYRLIEFSFNVLRSIAIVIGMCVMAFAYSKLLPFVILILSIPGSIINAKYNKLVHKSNSTYAAEYRSQKYYTELIRSKTYAKDLRVLNLKEYFLEKYRMSKITIIEKLISIYMKQSFWLITSSLFSILIIGSIWVFILISVVAGKITLGMFVASIQIIKNLMQSFSDIFEKMSLIVDSNNYLTDLFLLFDLPVEENLNKIEIINRAVDFNKVEFINVGFHYPNNDNYIVKNLSFELKKNVTALVGRNGSGKSTIIKLICGLYYPSEGKILFDGVDIKEIDKSFLFDNFSVFFQDFTKYNLPVWENIGIGDIHNILQLNNIKDASIASGAHGLIDALPNKFNQPLGTEYSYDNTGVDLSNGEWQRIALARSMMKRNPKMIVFDEPNSFLDSISENELCNNFYSYCKGKISLIVSHRLNFIKGADAIIYMDKGSIKERGTHEYLINQKGLYYEMYVSQLKMFKSVLD
jgi:ABC-type multidrug transport system fused ATPase/permease subunit